VGKFGRAGEFALRGMAMEGFRKGRLLRAFVDEVDQHGMQPLYTAVVEYLRAQGVAGAVVFRGVEGFGIHREIHIAQAFAWRPNLPIVIEVVEDAAKIDAILPGLRELIGEGLITLEDAEYLRLSPPEETA
jgi:uncharacterized protein